jgi:hypothetical protein
MAQKPLPRRLLLLLIAGVVILPMAAWAIVAVAALLGAMGDDAGQILLNRLAWLCGALWVVDLVSLVVVQAINSLGDTDQHE